MALIFEFGANVLACFPEQGPARYKAYHTFNVGGTLRGFVVETMPLACPTCLINDK